MESIKVGSTLRINDTRGQNGVLWQGRFFDRALRTVKEYHEKVEYIHGNPVRAGLVGRADDWAWSSLGEYSGSVRMPARNGSGLSIDRLLLPANQSARI